MGDRFCNGMVYESCGKEDEKEERKKRENEENGWKERKLMEQEKLPAEKKGWEAEIQERVLCIHQSIYLKTQGWFTYRRSSARQVSFWSSTQSRSRRFSQRLGYLW